MAKDSLKEMGALKKGLACLRVINEEGSITVQECSEKLDFPRSTTTRLLETLRNAGYISRDAHGKYVVAAAAQSLSHGFDEEQERLVNATAPILSELERSTRWSVGLAVPGRLSMVIRMTTEATNPFAMYRLKPGALLSMSKSSAGRAYLAYLDPEIQSKLIDAINASQLDYIFDSNHFSHELAQVADCGFARAVANEAEEAIAAPVFAKSKVAGSIGIKYPKRVVSNDEIMSLARVLMSISNLSRGNTLSLTTA